MTLEFARLLRIQRDLYALPRGRERFDAYLRTMVDAGTGDLALPLVAMNPMGKEHVPALIDSYLSLDADAEAERAIAGLGRVYPDIAATFRVGLVMADDLKGGWTNRFASEFSARFETAALHKRRWLVGVLWTSEAAGLEAGTSAVRMAVHRAAHIERHGPPQTLGDMLAQEGYAAAAADCQAPVLDPDDLAYTREVLRPLLAAADRATQIAALFGDAAATALGYQPLGVSARAGLALALHDALARRQADRQRPD